MWTTEKDFIGIVMLFIRYGVWLKFSGGQGWWHLQNPSPYEQLLPLPTPCFKMCLERSLIDPPPPPSPSHFRHLSMLSPPHPPPLPPPLKILIIHMCILIILFIQAGTVLPDSFQIEFIFKNKPWYLYTSWSLLFAPVTQTDYALKIRTDFPLPGKKNDGSSLNGLYILCYESKLSKQFADRKSVTALTAIGRTKGCWSMSQLDFHLYRLRQLERAGESFFSCGKMALVPIEHAWNSSVQRIWKESLTF